ncbi:dienelactone hydrolase family protein [Cryptosporangium phraense]|uniref:dienelactone hydrolase family protein n=1 Tax=Cryptosporangium phraense TaxID=2593070 RepID=UPI0014789286|nr:dienelactone hydrolase family protein [Cryptosporangium phraense]
MTNFSVDVHSLSYREGDSQFTGLLYRPSAPPGDRPGILLFHGGAGLDSHAQQQSRRYAELGYTVFAADLYGDGTAGDRQRILAQVTALRDDPDLLAARGRAALAAAPQVDAYAVIGFCFGGLAALTLARAGAELAGAELAGVISVHGTLTTSAPAEPGAVTARVLVCHGARDPHVPMAHVEQFAAEMDHARADWQLNVYGGAEHGFTHEHATPGATPGVSYHRDADARSHADIRAFLADVPAR